MENEVERFPILQFTREHKSNSEGIVTREFALKIILNNQELVSLLCSPMDFKPLAVGFLLSEGLLRDKEEIRKVIVDDRKGVVRIETVAEGDINNEPVFKRLITSAGGKGTPFFNAADIPSLEKVESESKISALEVYNLVKEFQHHSRLYIETHGVHSAALCNRKNILIFKEDIGRHNAIDKVFGSSLLEDISTDGLIVVTSGRISSEILLKVTKRRIPVIISIAAPTDVAVRLADSLGVTIISSVKDSKMNVYTNNWRIEGGQE